jgi:NADH-quinone oxidoreductase subunit N
MNQTVFDGIRVALAPIVVTVLGMLVLLLDLGGGTAAHRRKLLYAVSLCGLVLAAFVAAGGLMMTSNGVFITEFGGGIKADSMSSLLCIILCLVAGLAVSMSDRYLEERRLDQGEYYALILFSTAGAMLMALANDLVNVFVGLEVLSVALYILSGFTRRDRRSEESAVKYFLLGAFTSGFLLYGTALIYGAVGLCMQSDPSMRAAAGVPSLFSYTCFDTVATAARDSAQSGMPLLASPLFLIGVALVIVGLGFKATLVPFHSYAPDVYEGAPTSVTAFMSAAAKIGAFAALIRVLGAVLPGDMGGALQHAFLPFHAVLWGIAAATMVVGNVLAVRQTNIKRMLAYSSIAHAGYILVGVLAGTVPGASYDNARVAVVYYLFTYTFMNLGAFAVVIWLGRPGSGREHAQISSYAGLARDQPLAAAAMAVFMLSLAGIPPAAGFVAKLYIFMSAIQAGQLLPDMAVLAVIGLVVSVIGVYYYLSIIVMMYFRPSRHDEFVSVRGGGAKTAALVSAALTLLFGVVPAGIFAPALRTDQPGASAAAVGKMPRLPASPARFRQVASGWISAGVAR